jgi:sialic acid synthase
MKTAVLLAVRTVSKRLPHKILRQIKGKTVLEHTVARLSRAKRPEEIIVCTSMDSVDDVIVDMAEVHGWKCFRGSKDDVLERFYQCAKENQVDLVVRAQGDNMFVCPEHLDWMIDKHLSEGADWSVVDGLPWGMKSETISFSAMERAYLYAEDTSMSEYMTWYFDQPQYFKTLHIKAPEEYLRPDYRVTLDTPSDLELVRGICQRFDKQPCEITTRQIIDLLDSSPELVAINKKVNDRINDITIRSKVNTRILDIRRSSVKGEKIKVQKEKLIDERQPVFIIAEVGQNHNGDLTIAKKLIDIAAMPIFDYFTGKKLSGVNAVKFTKRDLAEELTEQAGNQPYISPHAFGATYLEHRKALELSMEQHKELEEYAHSKELDFIETLCSPGCLKLLDTVKVDIIKIASRDVTNIPLLEALGKLDNPVIISTGMCTMDELQAAIKILSEIPKKISILHCISEYPAKYENINLKSILLLKESFPDHVIGYSDHSMGIVVPAVAVAMGAAIIEKHITLSHTMKGSDHAGSVEPEGLWRVVRDIRNIETSLGKKVKQLHPAVRAAREKLARSLALQIPIAKGETLRESYLCMRSPGTGLSWDDRNNLLGKKAKRDLSANSLVYGDDFE